VIYPLFFFFQRKEEEEEEGKDRRKEVVEIKEVYPLVVDVIAIF